MNNGSLWWVQDFLLGILTLVGIVLIGQCLIRGVPGTLRWLALLIWISVKRTVLCLRLTARYVEQSRRATNHQVRHCFQRERQARLRKPRNRIISVKEKPRVQPTAPPDAS